MYPDESSLSLSILFACHNMIGWHIFIGLQNSLYLYDKLFYTLAYPFAYLVALYVVLLLLRWSSIYWCEQMREVLEVNREGMIPLHSLFGLDFCLFGLSSRAMSHVACYFWVIFWITIDSFRYLSIDIVVCPSPIMFSLVNCKE